MSAKCPRNHDLIKQRVSSDDDGTVCDVCGCEFDSGEVVYHCEKCDYDLCAKCKLNADEEERLKYVHQVLEGLWKQQFPGVTVPEPDSVPVCCPEGHRLVQLSKDDDDDDDDDEKQCDRCGVDLDPEEVVVHHCEECDYDLCLICKRIIEIQAQIKALTDPLEEAQKDPVVAKADNKSEHKVKCPRNHDLIKHRTPPHDDGTVCDVCGCEFESREVVYHCEKCDYDLCVKCKLNAEEEERLKCVFQVFEERRKQQFPGETVPKPDSVPVCCPEGHRLVRLSNDDEKQCDRCGVDLDPEEDVVHHCEECDFDLCLTCKRIVEIQAQIKTLCDVLEAQKRA